MFLKTLQLILCCYFYVKSRAADKACALVEISLHQHKSSNAKRAQERERESAKDQDRLVHVEQLHNAVVHVNVVVLLARTGC